MSANLGAQSLPLSACFRGRLPNQDSRVSLVTGENCFQSCCLVYVQMVFTIRNTRRPDIEFLGINQTFNALLRIISQGTAHIPSRDVPVASRRQRLKKLTPPPRIGRVLKPVAAHVETLRHLPASLRSHRENCWRQPSELLRVPSPPPRGSTEKGTGLGAGVC